MSKRVPQVTIFADGRIEVTIGGTFRRPATVRGR